MNQSYQKYQYGSPYKPYGQGAQGQDKQKMQKLDPNQITKTQEHIQKQAWMNIALHLLIQVFSKVPHSLDPEFLALYCLLLYAKKIHCKMTFLNTSPMPLKVKQKKQNILQGKRSMENCFCSGCFLIRKYSKFFQANPSKLEKVNFYYKQHKIDLFDSFDNEQKIVEHLKSSSQLRSYFLKVLQWIGNLQSKKKGNLQKKRSDVVFFMACKLEKLYEQRANIKEWLENVQDLKKEKQIQQLLWQLQKELSKCK